MTVVGLMFLGAAGWTAVALVQMLIRRPVFAAWIVLSMVVLDTVVSTQLISITVGGFRISPADAAFVMLAAATILRFLRINHVWPEQWALVVIGATCVLSLLLGAASGSIEGAVNDFRRYLHFVVPALYFSTVRVDLDTREAMAPAWLAAGIGVALVVAMRWVARFGGVDLGPFDANYDAFIRVLDGPQTLFVGSCALVLLLPGLEGRGAHRRGDRYVGLLLLVMVIVLNRRTVWLALAVALLGLLLRRPDVGRRVAMTAMAGLMVFAAVLPFLPGATGEDRPAAQSATDTGTLVWRLEGWTGLLESGPDSLDEYLVGLPFGSGYRRTIERRELESNPHSFYLQTFLRTGVLGVGALLLVLWMAFIALLRRRPDDVGPLSRGNLLLLLMMQGVWFLTWPPEADQGFILGLAVATAISDRIARQRVQLSGMVDTPHDRGAIHTAW